MCCDEDAFLLPKPLDEERLSGDASCGGGGSGARRAWRGSGRARGRRKASCEPRRSERSRNGDGGVGNEPSPELGKGTELRSDTCSGDHGVQAAAHGGQGGHGGQCSAIAGDDARKSGGAADGRSGARRRGRKPPSSEDEGAGDGAGEGEGELVGAGEGAAAAAQPTTDPSPQRDAGHTQLAVNRKHTTILDIPRSLNLETLMIIDITQSHKMW